MKNSTQYLLGLDIGSSSVKATVIDAESGKLIGSATSPKQEMPINSAKAGWAEQDPNMWWLHVKNAVAEIKSRVGNEMEKVAAIGISYQMHGLVLVDKNQNVLRPSIIWCDSRAVETGKKAFQDLGPEYCLGHCLNSPGNFTASKLKWVKENEPSIYEKIHKMMLPGDFIAMRLSGEIQTTISGLSEGILWDFKESKVSDKLLDYYGISREFIPEIVPTFSIHSQLTSQAARELGLKSGIPISYRAGDQPNNAFSLNVLNPGEVAATAGTSGVVYGIGDQPYYDEQSRVNTFVHVNHTKEMQRYGVLLCVNGTGILNSWLKKNVAGPDLPYVEMDKMAIARPIGSDGLSILPFGNGSERILENKDIGAHINGLSFNRHDQGHIFRAAQEGIVFALNYGFNIMKNMNLKINKVKAGNANMFLSPLFKEAFANITGATVELYNTDGAQGAARGAGVGAGIYNSYQEAFNGLQSLSVVEPDKQKQERYNEAYNRWQQYLNYHLNS
jgi:xylulokinase